MKRLRLKLFAISICACAALVSPAIFTPYVNADVLLDRSVQVLDSRANAVTNHTFAFFIQSNNMVGSLVFEYCTNNPFFDDVCVVPSGLDVSSATLDSQSGETGFVIDTLNTTPNRLVITRVPATTNFGPVQFVFGNITNPSSVNQSVYVRIGLHGGANGMGTRTDYGAVVFVVTRALDTRAYVPPHLTFCTGITVALDCTAATGFYLDLGELKKTSANTGISQYSAATNDVAGYTVSVFGTTMTSGTNTIPALTSPTASTPGTSQFGINLRDNSIPDVGAEPIGPGTVTLSSGYAIPNNFKFNPGDILSSSSLSTDFNRITISYLVNVAPNQAPGIYNATFTFVAVAAF